MEEADFLMKSLLVHCQGRTFTGGCSEKVTISSQVISPQSFLTPRVRTVCLEFRKLSWDFYFYLKMVFL